LAACMQLCPSDPKAYQACVSECVLRCSSVGNRTYAGIMI
jgi:hypothetical protein